MDMSRIHRGSKPRHNYGYFGQPNGFIPIPTRLVPDARSETGNMAPLNPDYPGRIQMMTLIILFWHVPASTGIVITNLTPI
jgi:hypothetical protein